MRLNDKVIKRLKTVFVGIPESEYYNELVKKSNIKYLGITKHELEIFRLRLDKGYTYKEISKELNLSISMIYKLINKVVFNKLQLLLYLRMNRLSACRQLAESDCEPIIIRLLISSGELKEDENIYKVFHIYNLIVEDKLHIEGIGETRLEELRKVLSNIQEKYRL